MGICVRTRFPRLRLHRLYPQCKEHLLAYTDRNDGYVDYEEPTTPGERAYRDETEPPHDEAGRSSYQEPAPYRDDFGRDANQRPQVMPAHPLPRYRSGKIDYDRYLEASTNKFKIFSAESRRQRNKSIATGAAIVALVVIIVIWAVLSK